MVKTLWFLGRNSRDLAKTFSSSVWCQAIGEREEDETINDMYLTNSLLQLSPQRIPEPPHPSLP